MGSGSSTNRPVQMKDIAKDLGVSGVTLSKVIRGRSDISWATRRRVFKRVKELNYQPNWLTEGGRVAQPFGFALTDPYVRLSRIRLFPKVTPKQTSRHTRVGDSRGGQRKELEQGAISVPAHPTLAPALQGAEPNAPHLLIERLQATEVARQTVVLVVPPQHFAEPLVLIGHRHVHPAPSFCPQRLQLGRQSLALRLPLHHKTPVPGPATVVRESQETERLGPPLAPLSVF